MFDPSSISQENSRSLRSWWNIVQNLSSLSERCKVYEQALEYIPTSYKLWYNYLSEVRAYVENNQSSAHYSLANTLHERCLSYLPLMPQMWLDYLDFLSSQGHITKTRRTYDEALQKLPITQHDLIWESYMQWADKIHCPETCKRIYERYLQLNPGQIHEFIDFLIYSDYIAEAVHNIQSLLENEDTESLWVRLAELISKHPECVENSEKILKTCLERLDHKGRAWELVAHFYMRLGDIDNARGTFESALKDVETIAEFGKIFASYCQLEEEIIAACTDDEQIAEEAMNRLQGLLERREVLLSDVKLRANPNDVYEWERRAKLFEGDIGQVLRVYAEAVTMVDPMKARGPPQDLWIHFAKVYEKSGDYRNARIVFYKGTQSKLKKSDQVAQIWEEWIETELSHRHYEDSLKLIRRICNTQHRYTKEASLQQEVSTNNRLWALYVDLEESLGTLETTREAYEKMITYKFANVHTILNYVEYLQENHLWEESFRIYEQGINKFTWPHVYDIWVGYLHAFTSHYESKKLERARDLYEQVIATCPKDRIRIFYLMYSKLEEDYGLGNHVIEIYEKAVRDVPTKQKPEMFIIYMQKVCDFYGVIKMRSLFEGIFETFTDTQQIIDIGLSFANIERKLGEIDRVRSIYLYIAQFCDVRKKDHARFWAKWNEFEIYHGNEETYREMMRIQRTSSFTAAGVNLAYVDDDKMGEEKPEVEVEEEDEDEENM